MIKLGFYCKVCKRFFVFECIEVVCGGEEVLKEGCGVYLLFDVVMCGVLWMIFVRLV